MDLKPRERKNSQAFSATDTDIVMLQAIAEHYGVSRSEVIRHLIRETHQKYIVEGGKDA